MVGVITVPHGTLVAANGVITGRVAGSTVMVLETEASGRLQLSVAVQVSVMDPPRGPGVAGEVEGLEVPVIKHPPGKLLV